MKGIYVYDIEQYVNFTCITALNVNTPKSVIDKYIECDINKDRQGKDDCIKQMDIRRFVIYDNINDSIKYKQFIENEVAILCGYNSFKYDDILTDYICMNSGYSTSTMNYKLFNLSQDIIKAGDLTFRYQEPYKGYEQPYRYLDLMKMHYLDKKRVSLKQLSIMIKWYRVQSLPIEWNETINRQDIYNVLDYNLNDVLITYILYWKSIEDIRLRLGICKQYDVDVLSDSKSSIANKILTKLYSNATGLRSWQFVKLRTERRFIKCRDLIDPSITFEDPILNDLLTTLKNYTITVGADKEDQFSKDIIYANNKFNVRLGGLHSADRPCVVIPKVDEEIIDADVGSFYPSIVYRKKVCPKHLDAVAWNNIATIVTLGRLEAKAAGRKLEADTLKIVANSGLYGKYGDDYSWLKDHKAMYKVTINGQLYILTLVEAYHKAEIRVISANTDGVLCVVKKHQLDDYYRISEEWSKHTGFTLEFAKFIKYVRQDVNNYIAIKPDGKTKKKGLFYTELEYDKGYDCPVIALCLEEYFSKGTNIDMFLANHLKKDKGIYDFCISQKTGSDFVNEYHYIKDGIAHVDKVQKNVRFYISTSGGTLLKRKDSSHTSIAAGERVKLFNDFYYSDNYDVRLGYYKARILDIITKVNGEHIKDIKGKGGKHPKSGISGKLFDNI